jgi:hypothetical protein
MKFAYIWLLSMILISLIGSTIIPSVSQIEGLTSKNKKKQKKNQKNDDTEDEINTDDEIDDDEDDDDDTQVESYSQMTKKPSLFKTVLTAVNDWWE